MGRSIKKGPFVDHHLMDKIVKAKDAKSKAPIKTWSRRSMITPDFVGLTFNVHTGTVFNPVFENPVTPAPTVAICEKPVQPEPVQRSILNPVSLPELSLHVRLI